MSIDGFESIQNESAGIDYLCGKCKKEFAFKDGAQYALKYGIKDGAVVCPKCNSVYKIDVTSHDMTLLDDISTEYSQIHPRTMVAASNKNPIAAALLSFFLFGGAGQIYLGQWKKGVAIILITLLIGFTPFIPLALIIIGVADAYNTAKKLSTGYPVGEWEFSVTLKVVMLALIINLVATCVIWIVWYYLYSRFGY